MQLRWLMALFSCSVSAGLNYLFDILPVGRCKETNDNIFAWLDVELGGKKACPWSLRMGYREGWTIQEYHAMSCAYGEERSFRVLKVLFQVAWRSSLTLEAQFMGTWLTSMEKINEARVSDITSCYDLSVRIVLLLNWCSSLKQKLYLIYVDSSGLQHRVVSKCLLMNERNEWMNQGKTNKPKKKQKQKLITTFALGSHVTNLVSGVLLWQEDIA